MATTNDTNDTNQATFEEFESEDENGEFDYDASTRADSALSGFLKVEKGEYSEAGYRVHSGSGETYAVDLQGPDGYFCQCEDRADVCKHIMRVLLENPGRLPRSESEPELITDGGEEDDTPEFPLRDGVPCPHRMSAGIELSLRWEIEYSEAKAFLQGIGFYGDVESEPELVTDGGREFDCSVCDEPMEFDRVRDGNDGPVVESEVFECENGHQGVRNYGPLGYSIQSINLKKAVSRKEIVTDGGRDIEYRVISDVDGHVTEYRDESTAVERAAELDEEYPNQNHRVEAKELITDGGIDLPPICPTEPERRNEHDEPICDECGMVVVDRENSEFGSACLCQGCRDGYYNELEREFGEELVAACDQ